MDLSRLWVQFQFNDEIKKLPLTNFLSSFKNLTLCLNGAYKQMWQADLDITRVIDVENSWGFWHMG